MLAPSLLLATVGVIITAAVAGGAGWLVLDLEPTGALLLGTIIASTDAAAVFFLLRTGGLRLQHRVGATLEIESGTNDPIAVFLVIILTQYILAGGGTPGWELAMELGQQAFLGAAFGLGGGFALVAMLNRLAMPGGLHPLFVVAGAITISAFTSLLGGSGLLAVYIAGLVMANRPVRAYPSIVGFHDAVTWLCQIVMFLVLGLLVTPSTLWHYAPQGLLVALVLTLVARPLAVWICLWRFGFAVKEKLFISWVGLRGAVSIFLAAIPMLAGVPERHGVLQHRLLRRPRLHAGPGLDADHRRAPAGVALKQTTHAVSRVEIDIPGQIEQEIVGYPVTADSVILGLSRLPAWARVVMVVRKGHDPRRGRGRARSGRATTATSWSAATACRASTPSSARAPTWRAGSGSSSASCRSAARPGSARWKQFYGLEFGPHVPETTLADWAAARLGGRPTLDATLNIPSGKLVVRRLESGRIASMGLQLDELLQVEPDEKLLERLEAEADELSGLRRWLARLKPAAVTEAADLSRDGSRESAGVRRIAPRESRVLHNSMKRRAAGAANRPGVGRPREPSFGKGAGCSTARSAPAARWSRTSASAR